MGTTTPILGLYKPATGEVGYGPLVDGNFDTLDSLFQAMQLLKALNGGTGVNGSAAPTGALLIGNGSGYTLHRLTAGSGITITNGAGSITIAQSGAPGGGSLAAANTLHGSDTGTDYTTSSASYVDVDAVNLKTTVNIPGAAKFLMVWTSFATDIATNVTDGAGHCRVLAAGSPIAEVCFMNGAISGAGIWTGYGVLANPTSGLQDIALQFRGDGTHNFIIKNPTAEGTTNSAGPNFENEPISRVRMMYLVTN